MMKNNQIKHKSPRIIGLILIPILGVLVLRMVACSPKTNSPIGEGAPAGYPGAAELTAVLSVPARVEACQAVPVEFSITNQGEGEIFLLTWYTPLEGVSGKIFRVDYQGQELDYLGPLAMRGDPHLSQYVRLGPGDSRSAQVDLSPFYDFSRPGEYQIAFLSPWISFAGEDFEDLPDSVDELGPVKIPSEPVTLEVLPSGSGGDCGGGAGERQLAQDAGLPLVLSGLVRQVSPSLGVIWLEEAGDFDSIALTEKTVLESPDGQPLDLVDLQPGTEVLGSGRPGSEGVLIADRVTVQP